MRYIVMSDFGKLKQGDIIDGEIDRIEFTILCDDAFYKANPKQFSPIDHVKECADGDHVWGNFSLHCMTCQVCGKVVPISDTIVTPKKEAA